VPLKRWLLCALLLACRPGAGRHSDAPASAWHYEVRVDPTLSKLDAKVCFQGVVPGELRAGKDEAASRLRYARWLGPGARRKLQVVRGRIQLLSDERDGCMEYGVSLGESGSMDVAVRRIGRDVLASPNAWLWRPERRAAEARATLELKLPAGFTAVLPWPRGARGRRLEPEAFRFDSYAAFGRFTPIFERVGEVELEAAVLDGALRQPAAILPWLRSAIQVATRSDGRFPRDRMQAIVVPSAATGEPVPFGMVARGGSASVLLVVSEDAQERALLRDWVLPHELSHLLLPYVERDHSWLSEGFATYYQELLLARAGLASEQEAIRRLSDSLRSVSAQAGTTSLVEECARLDLTRDYRKVYWGGAAYWLNLDVKLRAQGIELDQLLHALRTRPDARELWSARQLVERLDSLASTRLFTSGFDDAARRPFPPFEDALRALEEPALRTQLLGPR
jgi:hypothetical protein